MKITLGDLKEIISLIPKSTDWGPDDSEDVELLDEKIRLKSDGENPNSAHSHKTAHIYWDCPPISLYLVKGLLTGWKWKEFDRDRFEVVK